MGSRGSVTSTGISACRRLVRPLHLVKRRFTPAAVWVRGTTLSLIGGLDDLMAGRGCHLEHLPPGPRGRCPGRCARRQGGEPLEGSVDHLPCPPPLDTAEGLDGLGDGVEVVA